jgi:hypothetical protein
MEKKKKKFFIFEIPEELRQMIKIKSATSNITMRRFVLRAILEKIKRDESYN